MTNFPVLKHMTNINRDTIGENATHPNTVDIQWFCTFILNIKLFPEKQEFPEH